MKIAVFVSWILGLIVGGYFGWCDGERKIVREAVNSGHARYDAANPKGYSWNWDGSFPCDNPCDECIKAGKRVCH